MTNPPAYVIAPDTCATEYLTPGKRYGVISYSDTHFLIQDDADTLKRFADGHASEDIMAARLRQTPGVTLITLDPETGRQ